MTEKELATLCGLYRVWLRLHKICAGIKQSVELAKAGTSKMLPDRLETILEFTEAAEQGCREQALEMAKKHPFFPLCLAVQGVGEKIAMILIGEIKDIGRFGTRGKLRKFAGLAPPDIYEWKKGQRRPYNAFLKSVMLEWLTQQQLLQKGNPYRAIYDEKYEYRIKKGDEHPHYAARRKVAQMFLNHAWEKWRELEGLPIDSPYVVAHKGHHERYPAEDFGWPKVEE